MLQSSNQCYSLGIIFIIGDKN